MNETEDDSSRRRTDPSDPNRRRDPSDPNRRRTDPSDPDRRRDPSDPNRRRRATDVNETEDDSSRRRTDPSDPNRRRDPSDPNRRRTDPSDPDRRRDPSDPDRRRRATVDESEARRRTDPSDPNRRRDPSDPNRRRTDPSDPDRRRDPSDPDRRRRATVDESESRRRTDPSDPNRRRDPSDPNRRRTDAWDPNRRRDPADANRRRSSTNLLLNEGTAQQAWDKAVAFYAGSRWDSRADAVMLDAEANMLCSLFGTCDEEDEGVSMASDKIFRHFESGQTALMQDECGNLTTDRDRIVALMYVPLIQNLLYASYKLATKMSNEEPLIQRDRGHGIFFAKAMQPKLASCAQDVADIVARNLLVPSPAREMPVACLTFQQHVCLLYRRFQCVKVPKSEEPMQDGYAEAFSLRNAVGNDLLGESCEHLVLFKEVAPKQQVKLALERTYDCLGLQCRGLSSPSILL